jgi:hypothetical protein
MYEFSPCILWNDLTLSSSDLHEKFIKFPVVMFSKNQKAGVYEKGRFICFASDRNAYVAMFRH